MANMSNPKLLYRRELPGGGFVDVREDEELAGDTHRAHVAVERRTDPARREGHRPPIVATAEGDSMVGIFRQLLEIASDNVAIARALLRWQADGKARF
jgi:hypothetical protein